MKPLHSYVLGGLRKMCDRELGVNPRLSLTDDLSDVFKRSNPKEREPIYSTLTLNSITSGDASDSRGLAGSIRPHGLAHKGLLGYGARTTEIEGHQYSTYNYRVNFVPAVYSLILQYATTDIDELLNFAGRWLFTQANRRLNFNLKYMNIDLPIEVSLGTDLMIPTKNPRGEDAGYCIYEGQIDIFGFLASQDKRDSNLVPTVLATKVDVEIVE